MSIATYIAAIQAAAARGNATEHTFRPALKALIESLETGITATNEPRRIACGAPDFQVTRGALPLGHIEAKDLPVDLDREQRSEQMGRYLRALPNLILTNYLEFRWYVNGEQCAMARIGRLTPLRPPAGGGIRGEYGRVTHEPAGDRDLLQLLHGFLAQQPPVAGTPRELALRLANMARLTRSLIVETFKREGERGELHEQYEAFKRALIPGLDPDEFADMYAQTLAYGLFAARMAHPEMHTGFVRESAARLLPKTNPFLRRLFYEIAGPDLDDRIAWAVDDIAALLDRANMDEILRDFGRRTRQEDPVVHFYETFLAAYDPKLRESRGVYYTPEPVVSFIVRSVDRLLKTRFGKPLGLADRDTLILDPATGTATFLYLVIEQIYETLQHSGMAGGWSSYVGEGERSLLRRLFGFELLMAPYAVAHLKLGMQLQEKGYDFRSDERLGVYLTNALDEGVPAQTAMPFARYIAEESQAAAAIKSEKPIMVVLGNPPYSGHSENRSDFIRGLIDDYMWVDSARLGERNPKWLQDDYVKFIRFGQWRIGKTGEGILAYISNNGYLDNPTFRGMRQSLLGSFDEIYILNLHGNSKKKERAPDGGPDENVFDIQQGVAIGIFVKYRRPHLSPPSPPAGRGSAPGPGSAPGSGPGSAPGLGSAPAAKVGAWSTPSALWEKLKPLARQMRRQPTLAEDRLWQALRGKQARGFKFRRQHAIERFIVDFYCGAAGLVVEVDGPIHDYTQEEDAIRQAFLESMGLVVLRFSNEDVIDSLDAVLERITAHLIPRESPSQQPQTALALPPTPIVPSTPSPPAGRGQGGGVTYATVYYADLWGERADKYAVLAERDVTSLTWQQLQPDAPFYLFVPQDQELEEEYERGWKMTDVMPHNLLGFQTHRDDVAIAYTESDLLRQVRNYLQKEPDVLMWRDYVRRVDYRPFDTRFGYLGKDVADRPRLDVTKHLFYENIALNLVRQTKADEWQHVLVSQRPTPAVFIEIKDGSSVFPLYLYPAPEGGAKHTRQASLFGTDTGDGGGRRPNLSPAFIAELETRLGLRFVPDGKGDLRETVGPEDFFHYAYAVFSSPTYRARYAELLRIDFPRLPLTRDVALFTDLAALGAELVDLHLLRLPGAVPPEAVGGAGGAPALLHLRTSFPIAGSNVVEQVRFVESERRVYINRTQCFEGIDPATWAFRVGGYQVLDKWLKDRRGRVELRRPAPLPARRRCAGRDAADHGGDRRAHRELADRLEC